MGYWRRFTFILFALWLFSGAASGQRPSGNWTLSHHPGWVLSAPVSVKAVTGRADLGLSITSTQVENLSSRKVTAVKLAWYILSEPTGKRILRVGQTPLIEVSGGILPQRSKTLDYAVVSFDKEAFTLSSSRSLTGDYHIYVFVAEARYDDGTIYKPDIDALVTDHAWPWVSREP
jgi:hypothetical protein